MKQKQTVTKSTKETLSYLDEICGGPLTFGNLLESFRRCENWSQSDLARRMKVTRSYINAIEKGKARVRAEKAAEFAEQFGMLPDTWIEKALEDQLREAGMSYAVSLKATKKTRPKKSVKRVAKRSKVSAKATVNVSA